MVTEPRRPWWQATRTPLAGFAIGAFWITFGLVRWWTRDGDVTLDLVLSVAFVLLGAAYVASSVALVRRARAPETGPSARGHGRAAAVADCVRGREAWPASSADADAGDARDPGPPADWYSDVSS
ncbi:hypothetical protein CHO01_24870 [Cellulomonas hominis]|uniref:Uncharacterized protein n=2 Tax=Cellulomonas hominis TaxID=156981 RepID=A0A511FDR7_9CELL|nr:hypothetical protein [Cellulomonas hominis]MBB5475068.1 hypothetical protein [Cellulomonas hominis]GEL47371.1 hypothetical protein CHO01_24870 [Cellulomonas hominis]